MGLDNDVLGKSLLDYYRSGKKQKLIAHTDYAIDESYEVGYFFRGPADFPAIEAYALELCSGNILEIGAGAGSHSLNLQDRTDKFVTALDASAGCVNVMIKRGVKRVIWNDAYSNRIAGFDTVLMLMNGIGISGNLHGFVELLTILEKVTNSHAKIIFDSSDISYAFSKKKAEGRPYYGEVKYQFEYLGWKGDWFDWLYIDQDTLFEMCFETNWFPQVMYEDDSGHYLARLLKKY